MRCSGSRDAWKGELGLELIRVGVGIGFLLALAALLKRFCALLRFEPALEHDLAETVCAQVFAVAGDAVERLLVCAGRVVAGRRGFFVRPLSRLLVWIFAGLLAGLFVLVVIALGLARDELVDPGVPGARAVHALRVESAFELGKLAQRVLVASWVHGLRELRVVLEVQLAAVEPVLDRGVVQDTGGRFETNEARARVAGCDLTLGILVLHGCEQAALGRPSFAVQQRRQE